MTIAFQMTVWTDDDCVEELLRHEDEDDAILYSVLHGFRSRKRLLDPDLLTSLLESRSPFVRLAALDYCWARKLPVRGLDRITASLKRDAKAIDFTGNADAWSIFRKRPKFMRKLWRLHRLLRTLPS